MGKPEKSTNGTEQEKHNHSMMKFDSIFLAE